MAFDLSSSVHFPFRLGGKGGEMGLRKVWKISWGRGLEGKTYMCMYVYMCVCMCVDREREIKELILFLQV